ncbi:cyclic nucleotide-binding domain-containing protein [Ferrovibrio terrae]|uniref:cyclic nucleotide-binding domain-containing protein n=1 Tax=Ferrovibrio terrae TaxID=2594003 RepID=UPI003137A5BA
MRPDDQELFEKTDIYRKLGGVVAERLVRGCPVREFPKNAILTRQGEESECVHLILSGRVSLTAECCDGETTVVTTFGSGEIFVSAATILQLPYLVTAKTKTLSRIVLIPSTRFRQALETEHGLAMMMVEILARHWRLLVEHLREVKLHTAVERLASYLVRHCTTNAGPASFQLLDDRKTIAGELGMSSECLSRTFQQLRSCGVRASGNHIEVSDIERLQALYRPVTAALSGNRPDASEPSELQDFAAR